jgi:hypothetical protein
MNIRRFLKAGDHPETIIFKDMSQNTGDIKEEPFDKMRMIRNKMVEVRRLADTDMRIVGGTGGTPPEPMAGK